jgi:hypothetical protein
MTQPQKWVPLAGAEFPAPQLAPRVHAGVGRGPANAIIARLAQAIAEQNEANGVGPTAAGRERLPSRGALVVLGVGSVALWGLAILVLRAFFA